MARIVSKTVAALIAMFSRYFSGNFAAWFNG